MVLGLGKKNKDAEAEAETEVPQKQKKVKTKKPQEKLSSVVSESVPEAAIDLLKQNKPFVMGDGSSWAVLVLSADSIGGLGRKHASDEDKGSIVELIESDQIQTIITAEMLEEDFLGIIPTEQTIGRMDEYALLADAPYYWARATAENEGRGLNVEPLADATFEQSQRVARQQVSLAEVLGEDVWNYDGSGEAPAPASNSVDVDHPSGGAGASGHGETAEEADQAEESAADDDPLAGVSDVSDDEPSEPEEVDYNDLDDDSDEPDFDDAGDDEGFAELEEDEPAAEPEPAAAEDSFEAAPSYDEEDELADEDYDESAGYQEYLDVHASRVVTEDEVRETVARRLLREDLDLEIDLAEFERTFNAEAPAIVFDIDEDAATDWLASQVASEARRANAELAKLHQDHLDSLRTTYTKMLGFQVQDIDGAVSLQSPETVYYSLLKGAEDELEKHKSSMEAERAARVKELNDAYNEQAEQRARRAAEDARQRFYDRHRAEHEEKIASVANELTREGEETYHQRKQEILGKRRIEAQKRMEFGTTYVLAALADQREEQRAAERELMQAWNERLRGIIEDNRKHDIARADALAQRLALDNSIEQLKAEQAAETERLQSQYEAQMDKLRSEVDRAQEQAASMLSTRDAEWEHELKLEKEKARSADELVKSLREQMGDLDETIRSQYERRVATLEADKQSYSDELQRANTIQSRANKILLVLVIVMTVAAILVGFTIGWSV